MLLRFIRIVLILLCKYSTNYSSILPSVGIGVVSRLLLKLAPISFSLCSASVFMTLSLLSPTASPCEQSPSRRVQISLTLQFCLESSFPKGSYLSSGVPSAPRNLGNVIQIP